MRHVLATRRIVPLDRVDEYTAGWRTVQSAVKSAGGNAWLFRSEGHDDHFMEFLEWRDEIGTLLDRDEVVRTREALDDEFGEGRAEAWEEATS